MGIDQLKEFDIASFFQLKLFPGYHACKLFHDMYEAYTGYHRLAGEMACKDFMLGIEGDKS
jgi:hypothetical protein